MSSKAQKPQKQKPLNINSIALTGPKQIKETNQPSQPIQSSQPNQIFHTQPNIPSSNAKPAAVKASNPSVNRSYMAKPASLGSSPYKAPTERYDYRDPKFRLTEGVFKRLFEQRNPGHLNSQMSPQSHMAGMSGALNYNVRRDNYMPQTDNQSRRFNYDDFRPGPVFPNTPFKQDFQAQKDYYAPRISAPVQNVYSSPITYRPSNIDSMNQLSVRRDLDIDPRRYDSVGRAPQRQMDALPIDPRRYELIEQTSPKQMEALDIDPRRYEVIERAPARQMDSLDIEFRNVEEKRKQITPPSGPVSSIRNASTSARLGGLHPPTVEESAKMRNPLYMSHDFSDYKSREVPTQRYGPQGYNYSSFEPISPKDFLKSHVSTIATAKNYDMEQKTKIHPQLGMLGVSPTERRSEPILKPYLQQAFNPTNPTAPEYSAPPVWQEPVRQEPIRQEPVDPRRYEVAPLRSNVGYTVNPQPYQDSRPKEIVTNRSNYSNSVVYERSSLRNPESQSSVLKGVNKQPVTIMPPPALQFGSITKEVIYNKPYGQYASYTSPVSYPW